MDVISVPLLYCVLYINDWILKQLVLLLQLNYSLVCMCTALVPDQVKKELLQRIRTFVAQQSNG